MFIREREKKKQFGFTNHTPDTQCHRSISIGACIRANASGSKLAGDWWRVVHRNIVSTRKIRTSRTSLLFASPVPPCCIAAGCSPGKENYIGRLGCRFCVASLESLYVPISSILLGCSLTNIKFINGPSQSSSTEKTKGAARDGILEDLRIVGRRPDKKRREKLFVGQINRLSRYQISNKSRNRRIICLGFIIIYALSIVTTS